MLTVADVAVGDRLPELRHEVTASTVVLGALASRDWRPMHHDHRFAVDHNGTRDIFLNTPNQAGFFARYVTDWAGPHARLGRMAFRMLSPVFPGDTMTVTGTVARVEGGWVSLAIELRTQDGLCTECRVRVALPTAPGENPWTREEWQP
jgi:acyl dehydratase